MIEMKTEIEFSETLKEKMFITCTYTAIKKNFTFIVY